MSAVRSPSAGRVAAQVATVAFGLAILMQVLLALGVLPLTLAWGGTQSVLTTSLRLASLAAALILTMSAYVIRRRAGLTGAGRRGRLVMILSWLITAFLLLNTLANFASPSLGEKLLAGTISLVLAISCLIVSWSRIAD